MPLENIFAGPARAQTEMRPVANWLFFVWFLVGLMVLIGGLTRLTDSGLSITEWAPIAGAIPPLSQADWMIAFDKYKQIPEFRLQNAGMTLGEFKTIYWWEWGHRFLGRAIGVIFAVPLLWFVASGRVRGGLAAWLLFLLLLGGAQGFVGWIMVASGLDGERINVSHFKLAMHMGLAVFIFALLLWTAMSVWLQAGPQGKANRTDLCLSAGDAFLLPDHCRGACRRPGCRDCLYELAADGWTVGAGGFGAWHCWTV